MYYDIGKPRNATVILTSLMTQALAFLRRFAAATFSVAALASSLGQMSHSLHSLKRGHIRNYTRDYYRGY